MNLDGKIALLKRWFGILLGKNRVAIQQTRGKYYSKYEIAGYYNDLTGKVCEDTLLDTYGIPINIIEGNRKVYFPISIFQYALGVWDLYIESKDESYKRKFMTQCDWIVQNQQDDGSWNCFGPIGYEKLTVSSMGQGEAISVLARAYKLTGEEKWKKAAIEAMNFMIRPIEAGGTLRAEGNEIFFEEYADLEGIKKSVLNGWIFSLFGVYDFLKLEKDKTIQEIYEKSLKTLKNSLQYYDIGYWSYYDLTGRIASPAYHKLHIALLHTLADITDDNTFSTVADKWEKYSNSRCKKMLAILGKIFQKFNESTEGIIIK